jgi:uncharacterized damage-inducible protein DinB
MSVFTNPASSSREQAGEYVAAVLSLVGGDDPVGILEQTAGAVERLIESVSPEQLRQPESAGKWSLRHVLQHLADSELVWGFRLRMALAHDRPALSGYDQDLWADRLRYDQVDARQALEEFTVLRGANLRLLRGASSEDLGRVAVHVERGDESVRHMMRLYAGHDRLHLRQLERIRRAVGASRPSDRPDGQPIV